MNFIEQCIELKSTFSSFSAFLQFIYEYLRIYYATTSCLYAKIGHDPMYPSILTWLDYLAPFWYIRYSFQDFEDFLEIITLSYLSSAICDYLLFNLQLLIHIHRLTFAKCENLVESHYDHQCNNLLLIECE